MWKIYVEEDSHRCYFYVSLKVEKLLKSRYNVPASAFSFFWTQGSTGSIQSGVTGCGKRDAESTEHIYHLDRAERGLKCIDKNLPAEFNAGRDTLKGRLANC